MSRRNLILLIIILVVVVFAVFGFLFFRQKNTTPPGSNTPGTNFISQFNPFGSNNAPTPPPVITPPVDISGVVPTPGVQAPLKKLTKISSMPVAGFATFLKERLKDVPLVAPVVAPPPIEPYNFGTTTLKNGSTGDAVKEIQRFLNNTLNLALELNGIFDAKIVTAVKQWQSDNALVADGVVGAKTKALMYSSVNQKTQTSIPAPPPTEFVPAVRYVDRTTGNIYQTFADKVDERKFSATTIPKVYEAFFGNRGESVVMRYLKADGQTIETFVGTLPKEVLGADTTGDNEVKGSLLPNNVTDLSLSPDTTKIFYLFNSGDNIIGTTLNFLDNKKVQIFDSPFTEWLSWWPADKIITLTTKPAGSIPGYMFALNPANKNPSKILGGINGLTTLTSPGGKLVLYSDNNLSLGIYHTDTRNTDILGIKTLPEKCIWNSAGDSIYCAVPKFIDTAVYPDAWYQGEISFSDQLWKVDMTTGNATLLLDPAAAPGGEEVDGIKLAVDEGENYLFFVNKKDSFLWKLDLK